MFQLSFLQPRPSTDATASKPTAPQRPAIEVDQIEDLFRVAPYTYVGGLLGTVVFIWFTHHSVQTWAWLLWLCLTVFITTVRSGLSVAYRQATDPGEPLWLHLFSWGAFASGACWGVGALLMLSSNQSSYGLMMLMLLMGINASAMSTYAIHLPTFVRFSAPLCGLTLVAMIIHLTENKPVMLLYAVLFILFNFGIGISLNRSLVNALKLKHVNMQLAQALRDEKQTAIQASLAKSKFLASASHDLRQPVHALGLFLSAFERQPLPPEQRALVRDMRASVSATNELFNALLDISRLDAGVIEPNIGPHAVLPILKRAVGDHLYDARDKGISLRIAHPQTLHGAWVNTDPVLLERVLLNLVGNSVRYTQRGGIRITVRARRQLDQDCWLIQVWDTGRGIEPHLHDTIFDEFVQLHNPERDRTKGLGLGLSIVKRVCDLLHVPVSLRSIPGRGTCVSVLIPAAPAETLSPVDDHWVLVEDMQDALVVVLDDEASVLRATALMVEGWQCRVIGGTNIADVMHALGSLEEVPALIISDLRLRPDNSYTAQTPNEDSIEGSGIEFIEQVRAEFNLDIPAILITGDTGPQRLRQARDSGLHVLHKPVNPSQLNRLMVGLLKEAREEQNSLHV